MGRILRIEPTLPLRGQRVNCILEDQQPSALLRRELQVVGGLAPAPLPQLLLRRSLQSLAEQRAGGDAVWATIDLEAHGHDAIVTHPRAEIEPHTLLRVARRSGDHVRRRCKPADVARLPEVFDDERTVGRFAHGFATGVRAWGANERNRATSRLTAAMAVSICSLVVKRPRLKRSELCASWSL